MTAIHTMLVFTRSGSKYVIKINYWYWMVGRLRYSEKATRHDKPLIVNAAKYMNDPGDGITQSRRRRVAPNVSTLGALRYSKHQ